jgi:hypothetical protein
MRRGASAGHWRGSKKGARRVGGRRGREIRRRARVRTRRSTAGARRTDLTGRVYGAEREKGTRVATAQQLANRAHEAKRERERESAGVKKPAPTGWPHWAASERGRAHGRESCR